MKKILLSMLFVLGGCMTGTSENMHDGTPEMQAALSSMRDENERHNGATEGARSLDEFRAEAKLHTDKMSTHMDRMHGGMMGMNCQTGQDGRGLGDAMGSMQTELDMHRKGMDAAVSLDEGRAQCPGHYAKVKTSLDDMGSMMDRCSVMGK